MGAVPGVLVVSLALMVEMVEMMSVREERREEYQLVRDWLMVDGAAADSQTPAAGVLARL